jgi:hypothetical protein
VSKAEIKHTSEKVNITLYIYNEEKRIIAREIKRLELCLYQDGLAARKLRQKAGLLMPLASQTEQVNKLYYKLIGPVFSHILPSL